MDPILITVAATATVITVIAAAAVTVVLCTMRGTDSQHRAAVLTAAAEVIRAIRGRR